MLGTWAGIGKMLIIFFYLLSGEIYAKASKIGFYKINGYLSFFLWSSGESMVLLLKGYSEIGAHLCIEIGILICSRHLFRRREVESQKVLFSFTRAQHILSYHKI